MSIFVSYAQLDEDVVKSLAEGLEAARREVWFNRDPGGWEVWWADIVQNIRQADVVIFALSDNALRSKPCRAELDYAVALNRPILPIKVGPVANFRANPLSAIQTIDFRPDDSHSAFEIIAAVDQAAMSLQPLPDVLPPDPQIPFAYLLALSRQIDSGELSSRAQIEAVDQLRKAYQDETDPSVHGDILAILRNLKAKPWVTIGAAMEVDAVLAWAESLRQASSAGARPAAVPVPGETVEQAEQSTKSAEETERERRQEFERNVAEALLRQEQEGAWSAAPGSDQRVSGRSEPPEPIKTFGGVSTPLVGDRAARSGPASRPAPPPPSYFSRPSAHPQGSPTGQPMSAPTPMSMPTSTPMSMPTTRPYASMPGPPPVPRPPSPPPGPRPRPYWGLSIAALLGWVILGLVALHYSGRVGQCLARGDGPGAQRASSNALTWGVIGLTVGVVTLFALLA